jgi:DNA repair protein RadC
VPSEAAAIGVAPKTGESDMGNDRDHGATFLREVRVQYGRARVRYESRILGPELAIEIARKVVRDHAREHFLAIYLDARHRPIAYQIVSIGTADQSLVHPREVFQPALLCGAVALVVLHSHPSGDPSPSAEDREVTRRLAEAGKLLGVALLDHIVFTAEDGYHSFVRSSPELLR